MSPDAIAISIAINFATTYAVKLLDRLRRSRTVDQLSDRDPESGGEPDNRRNPGVL